MTRIFAIAIVGSLAFVPVANAATQTIDQKNLKFSVAQLKAAKGDLVEFTNSDDTSHNITISGDGVSINSGLQTPGTSFKAPLVTPGTFRVTCGIHPNMKMTIIVE